MSPSLQSGTLPVLIVRELASTGARERAGGTCGRGQGFSNDYKQVAASSAAFPPRCAKRAKRTKTGLKRRTPRYRKISGFNLFLTGSLRCLPLPPLGANSWFIASGGCSCFLARLAAPGRLPARGLRAWWRRLSHACARDAAGAPIVRVLVGDTDARRPGQQLADSALSASASLGRDPLRPDQREDRSLHWHKISKTPTSRRSRPS
ncbi:hypothetical protein T492DRAFT_831948 [Pavlovales sp. CCMP2436]|nr:hypothetical protein T492DRAFT_831948 [Pavlovales sp. CCMP2436]